MSIVARGSRYVLWAAIPATQLLAFGLVRRPRILASLAMVASASAAACAYFSQTPVWSSNLAGRFSINASPTDPPGILGLRFGKHSEKDALVLVPPTSEVWSFKLYARRAVVVDDKGTPFTDRGLAEWRNRMERVLGTAFIPGLDAAAAWRSQSVNSLVTTARFYGAQYVLTNDDSHINFPGIAVDREAGWTLWKISGTEITSDSRPE